MNTEFRRLKNGLARIPHSDNKYVGLNLLVYDAIYIGIYLLTLRGACCLLLLRHLLSGSWNSLKLEAARSSEK